MTYMMEDSRTIPSVLTALFCARSIERIGDRCQNICEFIFYYVKGRISVTSVVTSSINCWQKKIAINNSPSKSQ